MISLCVPANADINILGQQTGSNVVFSYSGSVDLSGLAKTGTSPSGTGFFNPFNGYIIVNNAGGDRYENTMPMAGAIFPGVLNFGLGSFSPDATSSTGDSFMFHPFS